jgi:hypothetical protein
MFCLHFNSYADVTLNIEDAYHGQVGNVVEDSCQILWPEFHSLTAPAGMR